MSFLKGMKPATRITIAICITVILVTLFICAAWTGCFDVLLDGLFGLVGAKK